MDIVDEKFHLRKRYLVTILIFLGWILLVLLRTNLSISLVEMTSNTSIMIGNETVETAAEFYLSPMEKGMILSAFSWGYSASPLGALLAARFGGVTTFGAGLVVTGLLTILTPTVLQWNLRVWFIVRIFEGIFESFCSSSITEIFVHWAPPAERSRLISTATSGAYVGAILSYPACGFVAYHFDWKAVFYITGGVTVIWYVIFWILVKNTPTEDKLISDKEKEYFNRVHVLNVLSVNKKVIDYPWKQILTSKAVWALLNDRFVEGWSTSFLGYCLAIYIKDIHDVNIQSIGLISGIPHIFAVLGITSGGILADYLRNKQILSITHVHKVCLTVAQCSAVILLITAALCKNFLVTLICFSLFRLLFSLSEVSYQVLPVDLCPHYASLISGFSIMFYSLGCTLNPIVMGAMVTNHSAEEWSRYFLVLSVFNLWGGIVFYIFGSGDLQSWAVSTNTATKTNAHIESQEQTTKEVFVDEEGIGSMTNFV